MREAVMEHFHHVLVHLVMHCDAARHDDVMAFIAASTELDIEVISLFICSLNGLQHNKYAMQMITYQILFNFD